MANQHISGNLQVDGIVKLANNQMNNLGDNVQFGDQNVAGHLCIKGITGTTGIRLINYNGTSYANIDYNGVLISLDTSGTTWYGSGGHSGDGGNGDRTDGQGAGARYWSYTVEV